MDNLLRRRQVLKALAAAGIGSVVFARALDALAEEQASVTPEMIAKAEWISGLQLTDPQRRLLADKLKASLADYAKLRAVSIDNAVPPALRFHHSAATEGGRELPHGSVRTVPAAAISRPEAEEDLAFAPVARLSELLRTRQVSSVELTRLYLDRLHRFDPLLACVITYTDDLALRQAEQADREMASGRWRGPLHGVPWGAKDLLAVPGYPTTWGANPFRNQVRPEKATVVSRLEEAGAVLVAKTTVGELAWGDVWFGGMTKNPWKPDQGSSGSSAGSAAATAAGLLGFAIGTETWGSIISPCTRCGVSGLRPTFGRVSRYGAMALAWSMDKIGPIARTVEDLALVFGAIHGADGRDFHVVDHPFDWPPMRNPSALKVGFAQALFEADYTKEAEKEEEKPGLKEWQEIDRQTLKTLGEMGVKLVPVKLPEDYPIGSLSLILTAEASTAFDDLTRTGRDQLLARQEADAWPTVFRQGQLIPAVEYLRANRIRTLVMREMERVLSEIDVYVAPSFVGDNLLMTNLTGHPAVVVPNGFRQSDGTPTSITFMGRLFGETETLALARAYQETTGFHLRRPPLGKPQGNV